MQNLQNFIEVVKKLRDPKDGCPWDLKQDHHSLLPYLIEESFEFFHAVENNDYTEMEGELGDILLQVVLHSQIASENKHFTLDSVAKKITDKMIRRHPHVFGDQKLQTAGEVQLNWQQIKNKEKENINLPYINSKDNLNTALYSAHRIGKKTSRVNFDWENSNQVLEKVEEELQELKDELKENKINKDKVNEELGDLLFSLAQLARHLEIDPELCLKQANQKFIDRFTDMEELIKKDGKELEKTPSQLMEKYWKQVKRNETK